MENAMKTIKKAQNVNGKVIELLMVITPTQHEYYYIYSEDELMHCQYDNNTRLHAIFNECVNEEFNLIYA